MDDPAYFGAEVGGGIHRLLNEFWPDGKAMGPAGVIRTVEQVSVPSKCQFPLLTLLDAPNFTRLAMGNPKSGPALPPGSGGSRGDARRHPFPSP